jgi:dolichol-phosphate mannosyltransferase
MPTGDDSGYVLTIVVPLYNEEGSLPRLAGELLDYLSQSAHKIKVLFVNDGSTDRSESFIEQFCFGKPDFSFIHLKINSGLTIALKAGFDQSMTLYTGYIDADLQTTPFDFDLLMEYASDYELVTGIREMRKDGIIKLITSKIANGVRRMVIRDGVSDTGCPLKIFQTEGLQRIPFFKGMHRFLPALVQLYGGRIKMVPVRHFPRRAGKSKYHLYNRLVGPAIDLIAFVWMRKRHVHYEISGRG